MGTELRATHEVANFNVQTAIFALHNQTACKIGIVNEGRQLNGRLPLIPYRPTRAINEAG